MSGNIKNTEKANEFADGIENSLGSYEKKCLAVNDDASTISANDNCKNAFTEAQAVLDSLKNVLEKDNGHIKRLAEEFDKFDDIMGKKNKS